VSLDNVDDIYPLSPMQALMLMHSLRVRGSSTLANQFRYQLTGALDFERFARAWRGAIERHPALRTAFVWEGVEQPLQVVRSTVPDPVELVDLSALDEAAREQRAAEIQRRDRERGFDLVRAPLMRVTVVRLAPTEHLLLWSRHHLVLDLWSVEILFREIFEDYAADGAAAAAPPRGFRDYVAWLGQQDASRAEDFWRRYLDGCAGPTPLFGDRARRSEWSGEGQPVVRRSLGAEHGDRLRALARAEGLTAGTIVQGAVALLVAERTGRSDVIFGLTVSGRPPGLEGVEEIMGSFINNLPVRVRLEPGAVITAWLAALQRAQGERIPFEHCSPIDVQRWSGLPAHAPLFDLLVLLQAPTAMAPPAPGVAVTPLPGPYDSALPMTLAVETQDSGVAVTAVYDARALPAAAAAALVDDFCTCLERIVARPHASLAEVTAVAAPADDGAVADEADEAEAAPGEAEGGAGAAPSAQALLEIWRNTLGLPDVGLDDDFFALGGTSVQAALAFAAIERRLGRELPLSTLFAAGSVRKLMAALELPAAAASPLVTIQRRGDRPPLLAASGIGGNVVGLAQLARALGENQPFYGLQSRALVDEGGPAASVEDIAADFLAESAAVRTGPCVLFGVCFGAAVILEMARQLAAEGRAPDLIIAIDPVYDDDSQAPAPGPRPTLPGFVRDRARMYVATWRALEPGERADWLRHKGAVLMEKLRHRDVLHGNRFELRQRRVEAANLEAARDYRARPWDGPTRVLLTADRAIDAARDPRLRWIEKVAPHATTAYVPGSDTGDAMSRYAAVVADHLRGWIDQLG